MDKLPRITKEDREWLQLTLETMVVKWFLLKYHKIIRSYGFEGNPYKLPTFFTVRILEMDYVKQMFLSVELHFIGFKQHISFHISKDVGPFQVKVMSAFQYMEGF